MGLQPISTDKDPNSHGAGFLEASQIKVFYRSLPVILIRDQAFPDAKCDDDHPPIHCFPAALKGSKKVFIQTAGVHRIGDKRACGAATEAAVLGIQKVFAG